jgi:hypothetical protein
MATRRDKVLELGNVIPWTPGGIEAAPSWLGHHNLVFDIGVCHQKARLALRWDNLHVAHANCNTHEISAFTAASVKRAFLGYYGVQSHGCLTFQRCFCFHHQGDGEGSKHLWNVGTRDYTLEYPRRPSSLRNSVCVFRIAVRRTIAFRGPQVGDRCFTAVLPGDRFWDGSRWPGTLM